MSRGAICARVERSGCGRISLFQTVAEFHCARTLKEKGKGLVLDTKDEDMDCGGNPDVADPVMGMCR